MISKFDQYVALLVAGMTSLKNERRVMTPTTVRVKESIATQLLKMTFSFYILLTITVTLIQMSIEFYATKERINHQLEVIGNTFAPGLSQALWDINMTQLQPIFLGMVRLPSVVGVKLLNKQNEEIEASGIVTDDLGRVLRVHSDGSKNLMNGYQGLFQYSFPLEYHRRGKSIPLGKAIIYSSTGVVFDSVKLGFWLIAANSIIKTIAFWLIFLWISRSLLNRPLTILINAVKQLDFKHLKNTKIDVQVHKNNELKILENAFNEMIINLNQAHQNLDHLNQNLERKNKTLEISEERFRSLLDNLNVGVYRSTTSVSPGAFVQLNPALLDMFRYDSMEEFNRVQVADHYMYPEEGKKIFEIMLHEGECKNFELCLKNKNGVPFWASISSKAHFDELGNIKWIDGVVEDITAWKLAQEELQEHRNHLEEQIEVRTNELRSSQEQFAGILDIAKDAIISIDGQNRIILFNQGAEHIFGYTAQEILGKSLDLLIPERFFEAYHELIETFAKSGARSQQMGPQDKIKGMKKDGTEFYGEASISHLEQQDKKIVTIMLRDITRRVQAEKDLQDARDVAEDANRAKSEFIANMSHELRTPMNAVLGFTDILSEAITDKKQTSYIQAIKTSGESLLTLINDILDLSKIEAGKMELHYQPTNLHTLVHKIQTVFSLSITQKNLGFIIEVDPHLPQLLLLDEVRLRQVLFNLVGNAVKFTERGFVKLSVKQEVTSKKELDLLITIEDSGIGIPKKGQAMIFESFQQQEKQDTRKYGGTGLGLAISKRLVEIMNGTLSVNSEVGVGSVFEVRLHSIMRPTSEAILKFENQRPVPKVQPPPRITDQTESDLRSTGVISQLSEVLKKLEHDFQPQWETFRKKQPIKQVKRFGKEIQAFGIKYNIQSLVKFGDTLIEHLNHFDIDKMRSHLNTFPQLQQQIKSLE